MELVTITNELMPGGKPQFTDVIKYPMIRDLVQTVGKKEMLAYLTLLVKDFCSSLNVVRNMNEDQMIEAGAMLLEECDNFRMEDYVMMFTIAKRGGFHPEIKIYDHISIEMISLMMDEYWRRRKNAAEQIQQEDVKRFDTLGNTSRKIELLHPEDSKLMEATEGLSGALDKLRSGFVKPMTEAEALADIHKPAVSYTYDENGFKKAE